MMLMKTGKAAGLDGITTEMIQHFGPKTMSWILNLLNNCIGTCRIPKGWRKTKVVALLKPGKDPKVPKSYHPISLLCILYKLYERMIMARMSLTVEENLTPDQAGFRPGGSTCGQLLNLTQYIEDGFEEKQITGTVFVDLTAAYDIVNHKILLLKVAKMIKNKKIVSIIQTLLENRRFFVEMDGRKSRWRLQKNGLPQGSILAPTLFNIYTNDQPEFDRTRRFIYADDLCLAAQSTSFNAIETRLTDALSSLTNYYTENSLNANPSKTQVCAFRLNNHQANTKLEIIWNDQPLKYD
ncbi:LINE-1 retrotransposable element ORF2 protein [Elysia marginata]|uniref:LINE-1 retrotransposable element ORF2 protein n=1 Tax=Elysia marginata TaxID=1093978 RepID=A0AAV4HDY1_9GAST|nr:LINE-1 retrotransposable element ORF2 protein [Elysia marginata]